MINRAETAIPLEFEVVREKPGIKADDLLRNDFLSKHCNLERHQGQLVLSSTQSTADLFQVPQEQVEPALWAG